jgi:hypothetical protein
MKYDVDLDYLKYIHLTVHVELNLLTLFPCASKSSVYQGIPISNLELTHKWEIQSRVLFPLSNQIDNPLSLQPEG